MSARLFVRFSQERLEAPQILLVYELFDDRVHVSLPRGVRKAGRVCTLTDGRLYRIAHCLCGRAVARCELLAVPPSGDQPDDIPVPSFGPRMVCMSIPAIPISHSRRSRSPIPIDPDQYGAMC